MGLYSTTKELQGSGEIEPGKAVHIVRNYGWHFIEPLRNYRVQVR